MQDIKRQRNYRKRGSLLCSFLCLGIIERVLFFFFAIAGVSKGIGNRIKENGWVVADGSIG